MIIMMIINWSKYGLNMVYNLSASWLGKMKVSLTSRPQKIPCVNFPVIGTMGHAGQENLVRQDQWVGRC